MPNQPKSNIPNPTGRRVASDQEDTRPTSAVRPSRATPRVPEPLQPFPRNAPEEAPAPRLVARPYSGAAPRPATEPPRPRNERQVAQAYQRTAQNDHRAQMRRFVDNSPVGWFHLLAHRVALFIQPVFAATVFLINLALQIVWEIVQLAASLLPVETQRRIRRIGSPTLHQDSPVTAIVFTALLLFTIGGLSRPLLLPTSDPRSFSYTDRPLLLRISDPTRALNLFQNAVDTVKAAITQSQDVAPTQPFIGQRAPGDHNIQGAPSISPAQIDRILTSYDSPAAGTGQAWFDLGAKYNIDPAYAVAFFIHESSAGTNPGWAGWKDYGSRASTHNVGNIICAGYPTCYGRFRDYPSWEAGIDDWYRLISVEYIQGRGTLTVAQIIPIYAPSFENNVDAYVGSVEGLVDTWRTQGVP